jgi:PKD repeat protein
VSGNQLSGTIPAAIGDLEQLEELALDGNQLSGAIPPELGNLSNLRVAQLAWNQLDGAIPAELANLGNLEVLWLTYNRLSGAIPEQLGQLVQLHELHLGSNNLHGEVPGSLANLVNLWDGWGLDIGFNALFTDDTALSAFLDSKHMGGQWQDSQTVAPTQVAAGEVGADFAELHWQPILYSWDPGGYEVLSAAVSGGPYDLVATTADKDTPMFVLLGLQPGTTYFVVVRTVTEPHEGNQNRVVSESSVELVITTRGAGECALTCTATAAETAEVEEEVAFDGSVTAVNCTGDVSVTWSFGDGSTAAGEDPVHSYGAPGTYGWQMLATADDTSCVQTGTVVVFGAGAECGNGACELGETTWTCAADCGLGEGETGRAGGRSTAMAVPAVVGGIGGEGNTYWVSEAMIHNPGTATATFTVNFTADDDPGEPISAGPTQLAGGGAVFSANFVEELFGVTDNGSVTITSDEPLLFVSRTFNDQGEDGTYGQFLGAVSASRALGIGDAAYLIGLSDDGDFRSNVLLQEIAGVATDVELAVYTADGGLDGTATLSVPARTKLQRRLQRLGFDGLSNGYAAVEVVSGGQVVAIASVVDESTGDAMTVDAVHPMQVELSSEAAAKLLGPAHPQRAAKVAILAADFTWSPAYPAAGESVQFIDLTDDEVKSWRWSFDDGETSSEQNPRHTFAEAGSYRVTLAVTTALGSQIRTKTVTVQEAETDVAHYLVAVVARSPGDENTTWRSDMWIMNPFANSQEVWLAYVPVGSTVVHRYPLVVRAGEQAVISDVVGELFADAGDGKGGLHVLAPRGVLVSSRTYNLGELGTFGQAIPALGAGDLLADGEEGRLLKLKSTPSTRCNIGFTEMVGNLATVTVRLWELVDGELVELASESYTLGGFRHRQVNRIFGALGISRDVSQAMATVEVSGSGRVYAYASSVDGLTGDAEFIPAIIR